MSEPMHVFWSYFEHLSAGRIEEAIDLLDDGGTWWSSQEREAHGMPQHKAAVRRAFAVLPMTFVRHGALVDGDRVALEVEAEAITPTGSLYNNVYCFIADVHDRKLVHVREYPDTKYGSEHMPVAVQELFHGPGRFDG